MRLASWLFEQIRTCNEQKDTRRGKRDQAAGNECVGRDAVLKGACVIPLSTMFPGRLSDGDLPWLPKTSLPDKFPFMCAPPVWLTGCI